MFDKLEKREGLFRSDAALRKEVRFLVLHHLRASQYGGDWTDSAVRRFAREMGPYLGDLLCLSRADITTKRPEKKRRGIGMINELSERISALAEEDAKVPPLPGCGSSGAPCWSPHAASAELVSPSSPKGSPLRPPSGVRVWSAPSDRDMS